MKIKNYLLILLLPIFFMACEKDDENTNPPDEMSVASCEGCHTNYAHLQKVYSPDTTAPAGGCGGDAPHYEPYDRVFMGGAGYADFKQSSHYAIGCVNCHNGVDGTDDKNKAHSGDFIPHPSVEYSKKCGSCHKEIVDNFPTSIHNGTGQKRKVAIRSGYEHSTDFSKLPAHQIEGYTKNCATCHASCGECHINRPPAGGGGLANGHKFTKTPDMLSTCVTCHTSRGGHAFLGVGTGTKPDVHQTKGMKCLSCHSGAEMHGDGVPVEQRYAYTKLPKCENCHPDIKTKNQYHSVHYDSFNCQVCHSQVYNNCGSCHVHGAGARIPSYMDFKIGLNTIPDVKKGYKFVTLRRTLGAPDNFKEYGVPEMSNFAALPIFNFTTPHNILRWTDRTKVAQGQMCYSSCHIRKEGDSLVNAKWFLFESDLKQDWEINSTKKYTVDNSLPESWLK